MGGDGGAPLLSPPDCLEWARMYRRIDNKPFSLERYRPLEQIYRDTHPFIVVEKPAQKGLSEYAVTRACHKLDVGARYYGLDKAGLNVGYVFSTKDALSNFSKERFSGLRAETDRLARLFTQYDAVGFKQAGSSYLYFAGGKSVQAMKSFAADDLILDEYDEIAPNIVSLAEVRLNESELGHQLRLSTPTFPNFGIDALYLLSDQHVWEVRCGTCGEFSELDFHRDVRADGEHWEEWSRWAEERLYAASMDVACPACRAAVDARGEGRWVARQPERKRIRGYRVPALSCGRVDLNRLAVKAVSPDPTTVQEFWRSDLGLPYEPKGSRVTGDMLRQLSHGLERGRLPAGPWSNTTMGVDVGARLHYRVSSAGPSGKRYVRAMGAARSWEELDRLMADYKVRHCVIDALPELHKCAEWAAQYPGRVLRAFYPNPGAMPGRLFRLPGEAPEDADLSQRQEAGTVRINRTMAMDAVYNRVATCAEAWPAEVHNDPEVVAQMKAPVRVVHADDTGQPVVRWEHTSPDHLFHACVYDLVAQQTLPKPKFVGVMPYTGGDE